MNNARILTEYQHISGCHKHGIIDNDEAHRRLDVLREQVKAEATTAYVVLPPVWVGSYARDYGWQVLNVAEGYTWGSCGRDEAIRYARGLSRVTA